MLQGEVRLFVYLNLVLGVLRLMVMGIFGAWDIFGGRSKFVLVGAECDDSGESSGA